MNEEHGIRKKMYTLIHMKTKQNPKKTPQRDLLWNRMNENKWNGQKRSRSKQWPNSLNFVENDIVAHTHIFLSRSLSRRSRVRWSACFCRLHFAGICTRSFSMRARANNKRTNNETAAAAAAATNTALKTTIKDEERKKEGEKILFCCVFHGMCSSYCVNAPYCLIAFSVVHRNPHTHTHTVSFSFLLHVYSHISPACSFFKQFTRYYFSFIISVCVCFSFFFLLHSITNVCRTFVGWNETIITINRYELRTRSSLLCLCNTAKLSRFHFHFCFKKCSVQKYHQTKEKQEGLRGGGGGNQFVKK